MTTATFRTLTASALLCCLATIGQTATLTETRICHTLGDYGATIVAARDAGIPLTSLRKLAAELTTGQGAVMDDAIHLYVLQVSDVAYRPPYLTAQQTRDSVEAGCLKQFATPRTLMTPIIKHSTRR